MQRILKKIKLHTIAFLLGAIVFAVVGVYAATTLSSSSVYYDNSNSGSLKTNVKDAIDDLYSKTKMISFKVGDYVKMTPTKTSFVVPKTLTGYSENQTINPSELNLWRVIRINSDSTLDMVSEYVSSTSIFIAGKIGYQNYVGTLNYIAKQYENSKYTVGSRHMGYLSQTEYITDTSKFVYPAPWTSSTGANTVESQGGGDQMAGTDENLVRNAVGTLIGKNLSNTAVVYHLAARYYNYVSATDYRFGLTLVTTTNTVSGATIYHYAGKFIEYFDRGYSVRPIVTLGTNIRGTGSGTSASPYVLS